MKRIKYEEREKKRKGIEAQRTKPSTPARAIDTIKGEKEHNGKQ